MNSARHAGKYFPSTINADAIQMARPGGTSGANCWYNDDSRVMRTMVVKFPLYYGSIRITCNRKEGPFLC